VFVPDSCHDLKRPGALGELTLNPAAVFYLNHINYFPIPGEYLLANREGDFKVYTRGDSNALQVRVMLTGQGNDYLHDSYHLLAANRVIDCGWLSYCYKRVPKMLVLQSLELLRSPPGVSISGSVQGDYLRDFANRYPERDLVKKCLEICPDRACLREV